MIIANSTSLNTRVLHPSVGNTRHFKKIMFHLCYGTFTNQTILNLSSVHCLKGDLQLCLPSKPNPKLIK